MFWWLAENTLIAALLALLVTLICRVWRAPPVVRHAMWLVVLIRLIAPPMFNVSLPFSATKLWLGDRCTVTAVKTTAFPRAQRVANRPEASATGPETELQTESVITLPPADERADDAPAVDREAPSIAAMPPSESGIAETAIPHDDPAAVDESSIGRGMADDPPIMVRATWPLGALLLWAGIAGTIVAALVQGGRIARMHRLLKQSRRASAELTAMVHSVAAMMQLCAPEVRISSRIRSPLICALGRAVLLWPESILEEVSMAGRQAVVVHELAHVARRDHYVGWLELVAGCLWWWNPLFWYVRHQLRENAELACDAWVLGLVPDGRRAYAQVLVDLAEFDSMQRMAVPVFGVGALGAGEGSRNLFERRLVMIMGENVRYRLGAGGIIGMGLLALSVLPGCSASQASAEPVTTRAAATAAEDRSAPERVPEYDSSASQQKGNDPFVAPAAVSRQQKGPTPAVAPAVPPTQQKAPAANTLDLELDGDVINPPSSELQPTGEAANPPKSSNEDRIKRLEDRLEAILTELREIKSAPSGKKSASGMVPMLPPATSSDKSKSVRSSSKAQSMMGKEMGMGVPQKAHRDHVEYSENSGEVETMALTRATYKLPTGKAQAVAAFLSENLSDEIEVRVKDNALQVTANSEDQARISHFIQLLQTRGTPAPKPSAPRTEPLSDTKRDDGAGLNIPTKPETNRNSDDPSAPAGLQKR